MFVLIKMGISFKIDSQHLGNFSIGIINIGLNIEIQYTIFYNFEKKKKQTTICLSLGS